MTTPARIERDLPAILGDLAMGPTPEYLDDVFAQTGRMRQRPGWTFPERWLPMADITSRQAVVPRVPLRALGVALVIIALLVAGVVYVGSRQTKLPPPFGPATNGSITYSSDGDIYVADPATGTTRLLVGGPEADSGPGYSADGTMIAFIRSVSGGDFDLYVVRPDGSDLRRLTSSPLPDGTWANWVPGSDQIALIRQIYPTEGDCPTVTCVVNRLDLMDAHDGSVKTIATAEGLDFVKFRPPDSRELLYRARVDGRWGLFAMHPDGADVRTIVEPTVPGEMGLAFGSATYSADGNRIFYQHADANGCCRLWVVNADGTDDHEFLPLGPAWDGQPVVSPDGQWIAYGHYPQPGPARGLTVVRADGSGPVIETGPTRSGSWWAWSPDSSMIVMFPNDVDSAKAYMLDPAGGPWTTVPWSSGGDIDWQRVAPPG